MNDLALLLDLFGNSEETKLLICTVIFCLVFTASVKWRVELQANAFKRPVTKNIDMALYFHLFVSLSVHLLFGNTIIYKAFHLEFLCPWTEWLGIYYICLLYTLLSTLTSAISFEPWEIEILYLACTLNFLVHLSRRLECTIVIMRCPSSVRRLSVVRLSSLTFYIFDFSSETAERNSTKLDRKQDLNVLYQVCVFQADRKKQDGRSGLWLAETFSTSPLKPLNGIQGNMTGSKISTSSTKFVFFGPLV